MRRWGHSGGTTGYIPAIPDPDPITVQWTWVGNVSDDGATVTARASGDEITALRLSTSSDLSGYSSVPGTLRADGVYAFDLSLAANTRYYYGFAGDTGGTIGTFVSFPTEGAPANFTIATSGDSDGDSVAFARIADRDPLLMLHMGDLHYADISSNNVALFRTQYNSCLTRTNEKAMHLVTPMSYVWNDHDFGGDDSNGTAAARPAAQQAYREYVPHWPLPADTREDGDGEIYHTFVIGRVRIIQLDDRSERSPIGATDNSSKTMLGADQKAWLKATLLASTEPLVIMHVGSPWNGDDSISWGPYTTERTELTDYFDANGITSRLLIINADHHWMAFDDGTNAPGGIPTLAAAPLNRSFTASNGTWTTAIVKSETRQYATIAVDDDGSDVTVTIKGWAVTAGGVESEVMSPTPLVYS